MDKLDVCRENLISYEQSGFDREFIRYSDYQLSVSPKAAVLVPLFMKKGEMYVLLTRRSHSVGSHKGQISFPGGMQDEQDSSIVDTALREAHEEVGLHRKYVETISTWNPHWVGKGMSSKRQFSLVYPVIAFLKPGFNVHADSSEVSEVFDIPLKFFLASETHEYGRFLYSDTGRINYYHIFRYDSPLDIIHPLKQKNSYMIWGFTGSVCMRTAVIVYGILPSFKLLDEYEKRGLGGYVSYINGRSACKNSKL